MAPSLRRSKRNKKKTDPIQLEPTPKKVPSQKETNSTCKQSSKNYSKTSDNAEEQACTACKQKFTPIARFRKPKWIQCNNCETWWHAECACLSVETIQKFEAHNIDYTCALCTLKGSPWILEKNPVKCISENKKEESDSNSTEIEALDKCKEPVEEEKTRLPKSEENQIIIIDNLENAQEFRSSIEIEKQLKSKEIEGVQYSYSLPKGGIALQFKDKIQAEKALQEWPTGVFHEKEVPHHPRGIDGVKIGFMKNVNLRLQESEIKSELSKSGISVIDVKRCCHRHSGMRMPVVKLYFKCNKDLQISCQKKVSLSYCEKEVFIEPQRRNTIVRCYKCMRYSHIAANCTFEVRCESCGTTGHSERDCKNPVKCANCEEEHKASSKQCPVFQEKLKEISKHIILQ